ncbi:MAG: aminotransferase class IV [Pirellulales bacterium]
MNEPIAFLNNSWVSPAEVVVSASDVGFMLGVTVAEQLRTFGGKIFRLEGHLDRLQNSLETLGIENPLSRDRLSEVIHELAENNHALLPAGSDLGIAIFITPGSLATYETEQCSPVIGIHSREIAFSSFANLYTTGQSLAIPKVRQTPLECWPRELKIRSRAHYYLADREAKRIDPASRAVMVDLDENVMEATTANLVAYKQSEGIICPPRHLILSGISLAMLETLAKQLSIPMNYRNISAIELAEVDEVLLTSTSPCVLPCVQLDNRPIQTGKPGPVFEQLITAWSESVSMDIRAQAIQFTDK